MVDRSKVVLIAVLFSCADLLVACSPSTPSPNRSSGNNALASPASAVPDRSAGLVAVNHVNESVGRLHEMTDGGQIEPWIHEEADWLAANPDAAATVAGYRQAVIEALQAYSQGGNSLQNQRNIERAAQMIPGVSID